MKTKEQLVFKINVKSSMAATYFYLRMDITEGGGLFSGLPEIQTG